MEIQAIYIKAFGGLKDYSLRFAPGANLLYGPNERGKTTVLQFIRAMFYGLGEKRSQDNLRDRYTPRDGSAMGGNIWFSHEGVQYELSRNFGERKGLDQVVLTNLDENKLVELQDADQPGLDLLGLGREIFTNSVFVEPSGPSLHLAGTNTENMWETLADFMVNPDKRVSSGQVLSRIQTAKFRIRSAGGKKGLWPEAQKLADSLAEEKERLEEIYKEEAVLLDNLNHYEQEIQVSKDKEEAILRRIRVQEFLEDRQRLRLSRVPAEHLSLLEAEGNAMAGALTTWGDDAKTCKAQILSCQADLDRTIYAEIDFKNQVEQADRQATQMQKIVGGFGVLLVGLGLVATIFAVMNEPGKGKNLAFVMALIFLVIGLVSVLWPEKLLDFSFRQQKAPDPEAAADLIRNQAKLLETLKQAGLHLEAEDTEPLQKADQFLHSQLEMAEDWEQIDKEKGRLWQGLQTQAHILEDQPGYEAYLAEEEAALLALGEDLEDQPVDSRKGAELLQALNQAKADHLGLEKTASETRGKVQALLRDPSGVNRSPSEQLQDIELQLLETQDEVNLLKRQWQALELAENTLKDNLVELRASLLPILADQAGIYMHRLSRGHYDRVIVTENLDLLLHDALHGQYYSPDNFSSGTEDQLWFAFRLSLTDHLGQGRSLPLLLDDLFINFDDKRALEGLELLGAKAAGGQQVILLTCHKRIAKLAGDIEGFACKNLP